LKAETQFDASAGKKAAGRFTNAEHQSPHLESQDAGFDV
jgi:hypothetical protein